ncbi:ATP-binding protein [Myxococcota bacterium]
MRRWRPSIQLQIFVAITCVAALIIGAFGTLVIARVQARANVLAHQAAQEDARIVALIASRGLERASFAVAVRTLRRSGALFRFGSGDADTRVQFLGSKGGRVFDSADGKTKKAAPERPLPADIAAALADSPLAEPFLVDDRHVAAAVPIHKNDKVVGVVRVVKPSLGVRGILSDLAPEVLLLASGLAMLALVFALLVGRSLSRPIRDLTTATRSIAAGSRARALPEPRGREVADLTQAFEEMRRELQDKNRIEKLTQDLSHELKNPLAAIRALTEALELGAIKDAEAGPRMVRRIDQSVERLDGIVADLLALARLEAKGIDRSGKIELARLAREAAAQVEAAREITLALGDLPAVRGDAVWLRRAIANLLSNAIEAGGRATLRAEVEDQQVRIVVTNPGEIPESVRHNLFERFVSRRPEGTGLGLAIVRSVAEAHGGHARLLEAGPPEVQIGMILPVN